MHFLLNKKNITLLIARGILLFLIIINFVYFYLHLNSNINSSNYAFNELFTNYQAGFIRRGLLGEFFWQLNNIFSIKPVVFFSIFFLFIYITQICLFFVLFKKYIISKKIFILIFLSPSLLLFHIYDPDVYFLRDSIVKLTILLHSFIFIYFVTNKNQNTKYFQYLKFFILPTLFIVILTHEYQVLFIGIHFLISLGAMKKDTNVKEIIKIYSILLIPFFLVLIFIGDQTQFENLNEELSRFNVELHSQLAGGFYKAIGGFYKWHFYYFSYRDFLNLFSSIILSVIFFYAIFQYLIENKILFFNSQHQKKYIIYFIPTLLTFFLATDHGRNISLISIHLIAFYSVLILDLNKFQILKNKINKMFLTKIFFILIVFFYIFMWKLDQMAGFGLTGIPNDIFQSSLFSEILKFIKFLYEFVDTNFFKLPKIIL